MIRLSGIPVSPGLAIGTAVLVKPVKFEESGRAIHASEVDSEMVRFDSAVLAGSQELKDLQADVIARTGEEEAAIFEAQRLMLEDPVLRESAENQVRQGLVSAERAAVFACEEQAKILESIDDPHLAARALDLRDIGRRLVKILTNRQASTACGELPDETIVVARDLAPSDTAMLDPHKVAGIVLERGGRTSHTAILARSLGIPAVVATAEATTVIRNRDLLVVDGEGGIVIANPNNQEILSVRARISVSKQEQRRLALLRNWPAETVDGKKVEMVANIGSLSDAESAIGFGADGVGLFRTEFLFIDRNKMPDEEEQFDAYKRVLTVLAPRPVVIRTLDVGGDKQISYLDLPKESNPFLGVRAIRLCLDRRDIFRIQLRALLRASAHGNLKIMFPMISNLCELREAKVELEKARTELASEGIPVSTSIQVGIMVEVPAAALDADILASECDFFSIGTNDLVQYTMACDRGNPELDHLSEPFTPAVLKLIKRTIDAGHKHQIPVGMCGEMAGKSEAIPLLLAMGLDEFSMSAGAIANAKDIVRSLDFGALAGVWDKVKSFPTADEIKAFLASQRFSWL